MRVMKIINTKKGYSNEDNLFLFCVWKMGIQKIKKIHDENHFGGEGGKM